MKIRLLVFVKGALLSAWKILDRLEFRMCGNAQNNAQNEAEEGNSVVCIKHRMDYYEQMASRMRAEYEEVSLVAWFEREGARRYLPMSDKNPLD